MHCQRCVNYQYKDFICVLCIHKTWLKPGWIIWACSSQVALACFMKYPGLTWILHWIMYADLSNELSVLTVMMEAFLNLTVQLECFDCACLDNTYIEPLTIFISFIILFSATHWGSIHFGYSCKQVEIMPSLCIQEYQIKVNDWLY